MHFPLPAFPTRFSPGSFASWMPATSSCALSSTKSGMLWLLTSKLSVDAWHPRLKLIKKNKSKRDDERLWQDSALKFEQTLGRKTSRRNGVRRSFSLLCHRSKFAFCSVALLLRIFGSFACTVVFTVLSRWDVESNFQDDGTPQSNHEMHHKWSREVYRAADPTNEH